MSGSWAFVLLLLALPIVLGGMLWYTYRRHQAVVAWAAAAGWTLVGTDRSLVDRWRGAPFRIGHAKSVSELLTGRFGGRDARSFAYRYTTGSGKNQSTSTFHVLTLALPAYLPTLELTHDGLGARIAKVVGGQDISFESTAFNDAWRVEAAIPKFAHDVIHPRLMERLLRPDALGMSIRIEGTDILCWTHGTPRLESIAARLQVLVAIVDAVPRFVWLDHGYDPGTP
jgi:hypothetical protein